MWSRDYSPCPLLPLFFSIAADIRNPARDTAETPAIRKNLPYAAASPVMATYPSAQAMLPQTTTSAALGFFTVLTPGTAVLPHYIPHPAPFQLPVPFLGRP